MKDPFAATEWVIEVGGVRRAVIGCMVLQQMTWTVLNCEMLDSE